MSTELERQIRGEEGSSRWAYRDSRGYNTIAIGRLCDKRMPSSGLSDEEQTYLFNNDQERTLKEVMELVPWINELDMPRKDALLNMAFQMGAGGLAGFVNSLAMLRSKNYAGAADNFLKSAWARQTPERARRVTDQIRLGVYQYKPGF